MLASQHCTKNLQDYHHLLVFIFSLLFQILSDHNILPNIRRYAGTSIGSIFALLLCLGYGVGQIKTIIEESMCTLQGKYITLLHIINY